MKATKKILIIDDDSRNIFALNAVLKSKKYDCLSLGRPVEGFQALSQNKDGGVVLMDMMIRLWMDMKP